MGQKVHSFWMKTKLPTLDKILEAGMMIRHFLTLNGPRFIQQLKN